MVQRKTSSIKCEAKMEILKGGIDAQHCTRADTCCGGLQLETLMQEKTVVLIYIR